MLSLRLSGRQASKGWLHIDIEAKANRIAPASCVQLGVGPSKRYAAKALLSLQRLNIFMRHGFLRENVDVSSILLPNLAISSFTGRSP